MSASTGITLFVILGSITVICQIFILRFVSRISVVVRQRVKHIRRMHAAVTIFQYIMILLFVYALIEVVVTESYSSIISLLVTVVSYMLSISLMGIFTVIFLSWYKSNRTSILVLVYGLSFATVVIASSALLAVWMHVFIEQMPPKILPTSEASYLRADEGSNWKISSKIYQYVDTASFS